MANLIPRERQKKTKKEFFRRFFVVFGIAISFLLCVQIIFSFVSYFFINSSVENIDDQLFSTKKLAEKKGLVFFEKETKGLNNLLKEFNKNEKKLVLASEKINNVLVNVPSSIKVKKMLFDGPNKNDSARMLIIGTAQTRDVFVSFLDKLRKKEYFESIESPVSNLLKERNLDFSITIEF